MSRVISSIAGTRIEPKDGYTFIRGTTATFKIMFTNEGRPVVVDTATVPVAKILKPVFLSDIGAIVPEILASINGTLVPGQDFEYQFTWNIPLNNVPSDEYVISYQGILGGQSFNFGDEFSSISAAAGSIGTRMPSYATVDDVRKKKFNIDDYLPQIMRQDLDARNSLILDHLMDAATRLREELSLFKIRANSESYKLYCVYYAIYTILLASRGEDGSAVSDQNITFWKTEADRILSQEKRKSVMQGIPMGRG